MTCPLSTTTSKWRQKVKTSSTMMTVLLRVHRTNTHRSPRNNKQAAHLPKLYTHDQTHEENVYKIP